MSEYLMMITGIDNLDGGLNGDKFKKLMDICFAKASMFSLLDANYISTCPNVVEELLEPYKIRTISTNTWFGYGWSSEILREKIFEANATTLNIIKKYYRDIFLDDRLVPGNRQKCRAKKTLYLSILEDICFFENTKMFFGTVSHECCCEAATEDKEFVGELRKLTDKWKIWTKDCFGIDENYLSYPDKAQS